MLLSVGSRLVRGVLVSAVSLCVAAPIASAAKPAAKDKEAAAPSGCEDRAFSRVFAPWNDKALYTLAPGGDFETGAAGWTLDGAAVAADSSPFLLGAALGAASLELPAGASAVTPAICVERGFPSFRFLARSVAAEAGRLRVEILYRSGRTKKAGRFGPAGEWAPTRKVSLAQGRFRVRRGEAAQVQLRFAATAGTVRVDDVYIDPRFRR
jgi:hypothetical protein